MLAIYLSMLDGADQQNKFERLYNKYERLMLYTAYDVLKDYGLAEDAVNESFIKIIEHFDQISEIDCPQTKKFIVVITRNTCIDIKRKITRTPVSALESEDGSNVLDDIMSDISAQDEYFNRFETERISTAISKLGEEYKIVLYLHAVFEKTIPEIAELLDEKTETIKKRIYRARKMLRGILESENE